MSYSPLNVETLEQIAASLPAGISVKIVKGRLHYAVKAQARGIRKNLGTFLSKDEAVAALIAFKFPSLPDDYAAPLSLRDKPSSRGYAAPSHIGLPQWAIDILDEVGCHMLEPGKAFVHERSEGQAVTVPANFVTAYLDMVYAKSVDEAA